MVKNLSYLLDTNGSKTKAEPVFTLKVAKENEEFGIWDANMEWKVIKLKLLEFFNQKKEQNKQKSEEKEKEVKQLKTILYDGKAIPDEAIVSLTKRIRGSRNINVKIVDNPLFKLKFELNIDEINISKSKDIMVHKYDFANILWDLLKFILKKLYTNENDNQSFFPSSAIKIYTKKGRSYKLVDPHLSFSENGIDKNTTVYMDYMDNEFIRISIKNGEELLMDEYFHKQDRVSMIYGKKIERILGIMQFKHEGSILDETDTFESQSIKSATELQLNKNKLYRKIKINWLKFQKKCDIHLFKLFGEQIENIIKNQNVENSQEFIKKLKETVDVNQYVINMHSKEFKDQFVQLI